MSEEKNDAGPFTCSAQLVEHGVRVNFFDRGGNRIGEVTMDPFAARRHAREIEDLATVAVNNLAADRTGSKRPKRRDEEAP